jgi:phosphatidylglycerophosphatase A
MKGKDLFCTLLATGGGLGRYSRMPGTLGSVAAFIVALVIPIPLWLIVITVVTGIYTSDEYQKRTGIKDPSEVIVDEIAGMWISMYALPAGFALPALFLFRVVDILKPVPVCTAEKLPGGLGIMADDVIGGIIVNLILIGVNWLYYQGGFAFLF